MRESLYTRNYVHSQGGSKCIKLLHFFLRITSSHVAEVRLAVYLIGVLGVEHNAVISHLFKERQIALQAFYTHYHADHTAKEAEARLIAARIRELTDPETGMKIWNGKNGQYESLKKKDIVILLRSLSGWAEEFVSVLNAEGIAAFAESRTGYFSAVEVETILNMLALIDNPMQDIPLVSVLKSPIGRPHKHHTSG